MSEIENPIESLSMTVSFSVRDWGQEDRDAWVYGIVCGWGDNCFEEFNKKFGWSIETFNRLKRLHNKFEFIQAETDNPPLTLDQLKSMHGKTVWVKDIVLNEIQCLQFDTFKPAIYHKGDDARFNQFGTRVGFTWWCCKYGETWLAYASKPEEGEKA